METTVSPADMVLLSPTTVPDYWQINIVGPKVQTFTHDSPRNVSWVCFVSYFWSSSDGQTDTDEYEPPVQCAQVGSKMKFKNSGHKLAADLKWPIIHFTLNTLQN